MNLLLLLIPLLIVLLVLGIEQVKLIGFSFVPFKNPQFTSVPFKKRKIAIVTAENRTDQYIQYHDLNFKRYSDIHGYSYTRFDNCPKEESSTYWCKIHKIKQILRHFDYVLWCDSDTIIMNNKSLDSLISAYGEPDILIGNFDYKLGNIFNSFCAGIFLIKNSEVGNSFIDDCLNTIKSKGKGCIHNGKEQGIWGGACYEEGIMNLLIREKYYIYTFKTDEFINLSGGILQKDVPSDGFILHLAGHPNEVRENIFKKYKDLF